MDPDDTCLLGATLFRLPGFEDVPHRFRVLRVQEMLPDDNMRSQRLQGWADYLWRRELRCPVYATHRFGFPGFLIPEAGSPPIGTVLTVQGVPDLTYHIEVTDRNHTVLPKTATGAEKELLCQMLGRPFIDRLKAQPEAFWRGEQWQVFYANRASNHAERRDRLDAFRGIQFRVVLLGGVPHLAADIRTRYVGRRPLTDYSEDERRRELETHLSTKIRPDDRAQFLRNNGGVRFGCRYVGETGKTIGVATYDASQETVYQYYKRRYPALRLDPAGPAVYVQDRPGKGSIVVPAACLYPLFTTADERVRNCSVRPQISPEDRLKLLAELLPSLEGATYAGQVMRIDLNPVLDGDVFLPPRLEFGGGKLVDPMSGRRPPVPAREFETRVTRFGDQKIGSLQRLGPASNESLPDVVLFYPEEFGREQREQLTKVLGAEIQKLTGQGLRVVRQEAYPVGAAEREGSSLMRAAKRLALDRSDQLAIIVLWDRFAPDVHNALKEVLQSVRSQCVTLRKAREIATGSDPTRLPGLLRNLALAVITEAGIQPWLLADALHHDVHLGIDLLYGHISYQIFSGKGGRYMHSASGVALSRGRMHEKIKTPELKARLEEFLRHVVASGQAVRSLIIHRDGRWWPCEGDALRQAIERLQQEGILSGDFRAAAVEVRKNHLPVRLFSAPGRAESRTIRNPLPGSYLVLDEERALLATTGRPGSWDGKRGRSASSLLLTIADAVGSFDIEEIAEDGYRLSHLNWSAPEIEIALPVTIRWADKHLRESFLREAAEDDTASQSYREEVA
ncbi:MAG: hypothetical protein ACJ8GN_19610 [Longimicrobiaceae bacterium]